jgi:hypothetical protein
MMVTLPEKLSREVERVVTLRELLYRVAGVRRNLDRHANISNITLAIIHLDAVIEAGHVAAGSGDALAMIEAMRKLEECKQ